MTEEIKAVATRMANEVFGQGKVEVIDELVAPDFIEHTPQPGLPPGRDGIRALAVAVRGAFPDLQLTIDHIVAEGDVVILHVTNSATMTGEFAGMPPSGKRATWDAMHLTRISGGKIVEHWVVQDQLGMLQQLGFAPPPPAGA